MTSTKSFTENTLRSMRLFLLLSFNALMLLEAYRFNDETDRQALLEFKSQVSEAKRLELSSWNSSFPLCNWKGVTCGRKHKRVTNLDLGGLQLGGLISPSIGNLSFLVSLNLSDNSFGGTIPQEVGNLFRLQHLFMSLNFLGGGIPVSLSNCSRMMDLDLFSNHLRQDLPSKLGSLMKLVMLDLSRNKLKGKLLVSLGNLTSLIYLNFGENKIAGGIPDVVARLTQMVYFELSVNNFSAVFPPAIYNLSSLEYLFIFDNGFVGSMRPDFGTLLPNIQELYVGRNYFTGAIPTTLPNISSLQKLGMEFNNLIGGISPSFGEVQNLQVFALNDNSLGSHSFGDLMFLGALTSCTQLRELDIGGSIPHDIGNLISLQALLLEENLLTGTLPASIGKLLELEVLSVFSNRMSGAIPSSIGNMTRLERLILSNNSFGEFVPRGLGNCINLLTLHVGNNKFNGIIPNEIMQIPTLVYLNMEGNSFTGSLPTEVGRLQNLVKLSLGNNNLSGQLPQTLGKCLSMEVIYLQGNSFDGVIPDLKLLMGLKRVDLSNNHLSGTIPRYFVNFSSLEYLNLSINKFEGKVPTEGRFQNTTMVLLFGNKNLCGGIKKLKLKPCFEQAPPIKAKHSSLLKKTAIGVSIAIFLLFIAFVFLRWFRKRNNKQTNNTTLSTLGAFHEKISYGDLRNATDGFSSSNLIGSGNFGTVFKALLSTENKVVAVKVLNLERHGAMKSFMVECESLKYIRHRNLVKLLTACSSIDFQGNGFRALVYEFMPNGSLDMWLHPEEVEEITRLSRTLTLLERLNIVIDVASVLDYLHIHCHEPIAHCDLMPSNILLDDDLTAHVSDFGLARLLLKFDQESFLNQLSSAGVRGTIGYTTPEYGMGGKPSIDGDVYSFGVLLLEMFSGKRPTNDVFGGNFTLHSYIKSALPERVLDVTDESILHIGLRVGFPIAECLTSIFKVGLRCCEESPANRSTMSEVLNESILIKERFFKTRKAARR